MLDLHEPVSAAFFVAECESVGCLDRSAPPNAPKSDSDGGEPGIEDLDFCNDWGPDVFEENCGLADLHDHAIIKRVPPEYNLEALMRDLAFASEDEQPFFVVDLSVVLDRVSVWKAILPRVKPFCAVKCNPDAAICRLLASAGCGFDCASQAEIEAILALGVDADRVIFANPCKQLSMLRFARGRGVRLMTADSIDEIRKIGAASPEARVVLRIAVDDSKSACRFNSKFGAAPSEWAPLLAAARAHGVDIAGVSFHVGSGCGDPAPYASAVASARAAFDLARAHGFLPSLLDVGGGFPGRDSGALIFPRIAATLAAGLDLHFPPGCGVGIIAEPGRYMCASSHAYAVPVIATRPHTGPAGPAGPACPQPTPEAAAEPAAWWGQEGWSARAAEARAAEAEAVLGDGVHGALNCFVFDHGAVGAPRPLLVAGAGRVAGGECGTGLPGGHEAAGADRLRGGRGDGAGGAAGAGGRGLAVVRGDGGVHAVRRHALRRPRRPRRALRLAPAAVTRCGGRPLRRSWARRRGGAGDSGRAGGRVEGPGDSLARF